jgi:hypothetical protein
MTSPTWSVEGGFTGVAEEPGWSMSGRVHRISAIACSLLCVVCVVACAGCGRSSAPDPHGHAGSVLGEVTKTYAGHLRAHGYKPAADEAEFKKILAEAGDGVLKRAGVRSLDDMLVSPRDSQPFAIAYGKVARRLLDRGVVAYEQTGVSGRRLVGFELGYVQELDQQAFDQLLPDRAP